MRWNCTGICSVSESLLYPVGEIGVGAAIEEHARCLGVPLAASSHQGCHAVLLLVQEARGDGAPWVVEEG